MENISKKSEKILSESFLQEVIKGLSSKPKKISSKYLYNEKGHEIYSRIMTMPEYYLTKSESEILDTFKEEILRLCCDNSKFRLIDLGAGDSSKTEILIRYFLKKEIDFEYVAIDIAEDAIQNSLERLASKYPDLMTRGIQAEYSEALLQLKDFPEKNLLLFLGSNLGNFDFRDAVCFLKKINDSLNRNDLLLLGLDLKKNPQKIINAYCDTENITAEFNLNLLDRINRELDADFDKRNFRHFCSYNPENGEAKSFLISQKDQNVTLKKENERSFHFDRWETVQLECSNKYDMVGITELADQSGFSIVKSFFDQEINFTDSLWKKK